MFQLIGGWGKMKMKKEFMKIISDIYDEIAPMDFHFTNGVSPDWIRKRRFIKELKKRW